MDPVGRATTVNLTPLLAVPPMVTTTLPVVAPEGTLTTIADPLQFATEAWVPLNVTVLEPEGAPKFDPEIVTDAPDTPEDGDMPETLGGPGGGPMISVWLDVPAQPIRQSKSEIRANCPKIMAPERAEVGRLRMHALPKNQAGVVGFVNYNPRFAAKFRSKGA